MCDAHKATDQDHQLSCEVPRASSVLHHDGLAGSVSLGPFELTPANSQVTKNQEPIEP